MERKKLLLLGIGVGILLFSGLGVVTVQAAKNSKSGDALYFLDNAIENLERSLISDAQAKATYESLVLEERINEMEDLLDDNSPSFDDSLLEVEEQKDLLESLLDDCVNCTDEQDKLVNLYSRIIEILESEGLVNLTDEEEESIYNELLSELQDKVQEREREQLELRLELEKESMEQEQEREREEMENLSEAEREALEQEQEREREALEQRQEQEKNALEDSVDDSSEDEDEIEDEEDVETEDEEDDSNGNGNSGNN